MTKIEVQQRNAYAMLCRRQAHEINRLFKRGNFSSPEFQAKARSMKRRHMHERWELRKWLLRMEQRELALA